MNSLKYLRVIDDSFLVDFLLRDDRGGVIWFVWGTLYKVYGFFVGEGVREEARVVVVVTVVIVVAIFIDSSFLSVWFIEVSGIVRLSRSIDLTGFCSCSSSSNISSISISSAAPLWLLIVFGIVINLEISVIAVIVSTFEDIGTDLIGSVFVCIVSSLICDDGKRTGGASK